MCKHADERDVCPRADWPAPFQKGLCCPAPVSVLGWPRTACGLRSSRKTADGPLRLQSPPKARQVPVGLLCASTSPSATLLPSRPFPGRSPEPPSTPPQRAPRGQQCWHGRGTCLKRGRRLTIQHRRRHRPLGSGRELAQVAGNAVRSGTPSHPSVTPGGHSPRTPLWPPRPRRHGRWCWPWEGAPRSGRTT